MATHVTGKYTRVVPGILILAGLALFAAGILRSAPAAILQGPLMLTLAGAALLAVTSIVLFLSYWNRNQELPGQLAASAVQGSVLLVVTGDTSGAVTLFNPAAERTLGYRQEEVLGRPVAELFSPGEVERISQTLRLQRGMQQQPNAQRAPGDFSILLDYLRNVPPGRARGFEMQLRRRDGSTVPGMVYLSGIRDGEGNIAGFCGITADISVARRAEHALRESQERYRDLFENSNEMIATLSPGGRYLYSNPAWQSCFGLDESSLEALPGFEAAFPAETQPEAAALFRRALEGERIERAIVRTQSRSGHALELEVNMSRRLENSKPVSVRALFRDITQQRQRERRLAMQLIVSQVMAESTSTEEAAPRILESLCLNMGYDVAAMWLVSENQQHLQFYSAWGAPGPLSETFIYDSLRRTVRPDEDIPGRVWASGRQIWVEDITADQGLPGNPAAATGALHTGWGVPLRVGNKIMAVIEFYSRQRQKEDPETMATAETIGASLGQFLARSRQEGRVQELNRQQEIILDSVADGIVGTDREGRITFANPAAAALFSEAAEGLVSRRIHETVHGNRPPGDDCGEQCLFLRAFAARESATGQEVFFRADGSSFPVEFSITPMVEHARYIGTVVSFRDISQRYALDRMKDEFISTVSHELRTPLTSIRGSLGLLSAGLMGTVNEKAANLLRIAVSNSDRLVRLINDILDLERIQSGRAPLAFRRSLLTDLVQQAIDAMNPVADNAGIRLTADGAPLAMEADPDRLMQVMTNLLSNAIKFSPPGATVHTSVRAGSEGVTISVTDQGRGIPADKLESIFDRFQQVDASDSRLKGGTGLGLAICRTIVQQHSGRIWAERNEGPGSTFRIFLPFSRGREQPAGLPPAMGAETDARSGTLLVTDGNGESRRRMAAMLRRRGYRVLEAETASQTLAYAGESRVDAILLDAGVEEGSSWETLRQLKAQAAHVPVVILSLKGFPDIGELPAEAAGWLQQPVSEEAVLAMLARTLPEDGQAARILVVEDDPDLATILRDVFTHAGIEVHLAATRHAAFEACARLKPQMLVLDLSLPDGDGFNVVDWLRQREDLSRIPLVVYSAREIAPEERARLALGPTHFLTKARVTPQQMEALVLTMLRRSGQMDGDSPRERTELT